MDLIQLKTACSLPFAVFFECDRELDVYVLPVEGAIDVVKAELTASEPKPYDGQLFKKQIGINGKPESAKFY